MGFGTVASVFGRAIDGGPRDAVGSIETVSTAALFVFHFTVLPSETRGAHAVLEVDVNILVGLEELLFRLGVVAQAHVTPASVLTLQPTVTVVHLMSRILTATSHKSLRTGAFHQLLCTIVDTG